MKRFITVCLLILLPSVGQAGDQNDGILSLQPELRLLLSQEMVQLRKGMLEIMNAYIAGQWSAISQIAKTMESTYILKQSLSAEQHRALHTQLPRGFLNLDKQFHYYAGMLSHAAEMGKVELISFYYSKMSETCVSCHSTYATHKFPSFAQNKLPEQHHH